MRSRTVTIQALDSRRFTPGEEWVLDRSRLPNALIIENRCLHGASTPLLSPFVVVPINLKSTE